MANARRLLSLFLVLLSAALLAYTAYRAGVLSMTHDESTTYNWFRETNVFTCFYSKECWHNANNHLLNTWAWQQTVSLFGVSEWAIRLPNLLAHALYLLCSLAIVRMVKPGFWIGLAGFAFINFNPYLLEFFSLARGYGLSIGLNLASIYALFRFLQHGRWPALLGSYALAALAILANFVAIHFFASLWGTVFLMSLFRQGGWTGKVGWAWKRQLWMNAIPLAIAAILALLLYRPIGFLHDTGDFTQYGTSSFIGAFRSVAENGLYGIRYFSKDTVPIFLLLYIMLIVTALAGAFRFFFRAPPERWRQYYLATALLFLLSCGIMTAQHQLLGSNYLEGRKALLFISLSGLLFFFLLYGLAERWMSSRLAGISGAVVLLLLGYHLIRAGNFDYSREWQYDRNTRAMMRYLDSIVPPDSGPVTLGVTHLFQPTVAFYANTRELDSFIIPPYANELYTDGRYEYYYVFDGQVAELSKKYEIERQFPGGRTLLKRKE